MLREDGGLSLYDYDQGDGERVHWWKGEHPRSGKRCHRRRTGRGLTSRSNHTAAMTPFTCRESWTRQRWPAAGRYIIENLLQQDYVSGVFVNEKRIGQVGGALSLEHLNVSTDDDYFDPVPDIVVNFTSAVMSCDPAGCARCQSPTLRPTKGTTWRWVSAVLRPRASWLHVNRTFGRRSSAKHRQAPADMMRTIEAPDSGRSGRRHKGERARID